MHSHTQDALEYLLCVGRAGGNERTSSSLSEDEGFTLPLPPPRDPGILRTDELGVVAAILGVPEASAWSHLAPSWPPGGTLATHHASILSPRSPNMDPFGSFGLLLPPTFPLGGQFCCVL